MGAFILGENKMANPYAETPFQIARNARKAEKSKKEKASDKK